jgi:hypothetical protein
MKPFMFIQFHNWHQNSLSLSWSANITMSPFVFVSDQDSVRLLAVEGCAALGKLLEPQDCVAHILPVIVNFSQV